MQEQNTESRACQVLLIDDEPGIIEILELELKGRNISYLSASDGKTALELIEQCNPAVIVSDYKMPGLDGMELLHFLRNLGNPAPVIWITAYADAKTAKEAWSLGVFHLFPKPVDPKDVGIEVEKALNVTSNDSLNLQTPYLTETLRKIHFQKLQIEIDRPLYERAKQHCLERSLSINSFILELIKNDLG